MKDYRKQSGATLVEVLLIIAIFVIILSSAISLTTTQLFESDLDSKALEVSNLVETARSNSSTGYHGDVWSIKVLDSDPLCLNSGDCVLLFKGNDFSGRDTAYDRFVQFDQDISGVYVDSNQENEFYFDYKSGWLSTSTATRLEQQNIVLKSNFGDQKSVIVYPSGAFSTFTCGEDKIFDSQGNGYTTVKIGTQCWMAENLNVGTMLASAATTPSDNSIIEKWCYDDLSTNCDSQGGLYDFNELMNYSPADGGQGICPGGWHLPTSQEMTTLTGNYPSTLDGYNLRLGGPSGFNLPSSGKMSSAAYSGQGTLANLWSGFYGGPGSVIVYYIDDTSNADDMTLTFTTESIGYGARCLKDY